MSDRETRAKVKPHMDTFLPPIGKPRGLIMKLLYAMIRRQFGKVFTAAAGLKRQKRTSVTAS